jgi:hypothetical protein
MTLRLQTIGVALLGLVMGGCGGVYFVPDMYEIDHYDPRVMHGHELQSRRGFKNARPEDLVVPNVVDGALPKVMLKPTPWEGLYGDVMGRENLFSGPFGSEGYVALWGQMPSTRWVDVTSLVPCRYIADIPTINSDTLRGNAIFMNAGELWTGPYMSCVYKTHRDFAAGVALVKDLDGVVFGPTYSPPEPLGFPTYLAQGHTIIGYGFKFAEPTDPGLRARLTPPYGLGATNKWGIIYQDVITPTRERDALWYARQRNMQPNIQTEDELWAETAKAKARLALFLTKMAAYWVYQHQAREYVDVMWQGLRAARSMRDPTLVMPRHFDPAKLLILRSLRKMVTEADGPLWMEVLAAQVDAETDARGAKFGTMEGYKTGPGSIALGALVCTGQAQHAEKIAEVGMRTDSLELKKEIALALKREFKRPDLSAPVVRSCRGTTNCYQLERYMELNYHSFGCRDELEWN